jgi:hypothetical protein
MKKNLGVDPLGRDWSAFHHRMRFVYISPRQSSADPVKGETTSISGLLEKNKNQYVLTDTKSGVSYRLVGLKKAEEAQLSRYVGKTVTVRLVVKSTESAKVHIAQLVVILN